MPIAVFEIPGLSLPRRTTDTLICTVSSILYQGPAMSLYGYAGVYQGTDSAARWEEFNPETLESLVRQFSVPVSPSPRDIVNPVGPFQMRPRPSTDPHSPTLGPALAALLISTSVDLSDTFVIAKALSPNAYDIQPIGQIVPPSGLLATSYLGSDGVPVVDLSWFRGSGGVMQAEFIDIVIANSLSEAQAAFRGIPGVDFISIDTNTLPFGLQDLGGGRVMAGGLPVSPNAHHWWRVNELINNAWYPSPVVDFMSVGQGATQPQITNIQVTFS